jgi:type IV secretory pathway ATPase VirB11/archaellum biosynthesis ATPase
MKESARMLVLAEDINAKFDAILEYVKDIPDIRRRVMRLEEDVATLKSDMVVVKFGLKMHSEQIAELQNRLGGWPN